MAKTVEQMYTSMPQHDRDRYVSLYKRRFNAYWLPALKEGETEELLLLEERYSLEDIIRCRSRTFIEVRYFVFCFALRPTTYHLPQLRT